MVDLQQEYARLVAALKAHEEYPRLYPDAYMRFEFEVDLGDGYSWFYHHWRDGGQYNGIDLTCERPSEAFAEADNYTRFRRDTDIERCAKTAFDVVALLIRPWASTSPALQVALAQWPPPPLWYCFDQQLTCLGDFIRTTSLHDFTLIEAFDYHQANERFEQLLMAEGLSDSLGDMGMPNCEVCGSSLYRWERFNQSLTIIGEKAYLPYQLETVQHQYKNHVRTHPLAKELA